MNSISSPARGLAIYGGSAFLVYIETDGFRKRAPFLGSLPFLILAGLTLTTHMFRHVRYPTAASFLVLAVAHYLLHAHLLFGLAALLMAFANGLYVFSLRQYVKEWSSPLLLLSAVLFGLFFWTVLSDVFFSIPTLVVCLAAALAAALILLALSGSFLQYGGVGYMDDSLSVNSVRLAGALCTSLAVSLYVADLLAYHDERLISIRRFALYLGQGMLFLANERAF